MSDGVMAGVIGLAVVVAFLFSGMEAGVLNLSRIRIRRMARQDDPRARRLQGYLENPETFLWTILVGNTLAALVVVALATLRLQAAFPQRPVAFTLSIAGVLLALYMVADLLPKLLFRRFPNRLCLAGVVPFRFLAMVLSPVVDLTEWVSRRLLRLTGGQAFTGRLFSSRAELRQVIEASAQSLSREELVMINRILDLQNLSVRDVMTPMDRAVTLDAESTVEDLLSVVRERRVSFVPVWRERGKGRGRRVLGVVWMGSVIYQETPPGGEVALQGLVQPALFVGETMRLEEALRAMQRGRQRLAVVLDSERRETGVVTLNDILRAMFGEVRV